MKKAVSQAKDALSVGEFPVGCVVVHQNQIIASGTRTGSMGTCPNEIDHGEMIALRHLVNRHYTRSLSKATLYTTLEPCLMCFGAILLSGIRRIVFAYEDIMGGGTSCDLQKLNPLYRDINIKIIPHVLRKESLDLFKQFFDDPANTYWKDSVLARYTLKQ